MRSTGVTHDDSRLHDVFASPLVFSVMAALTGSVELEFRTLRRVLQCESAALSGAINALRAAHCVKVRKETLGDFSQSWVCATLQGDDAFVAHLNALEEIASGRA